MARNWIGGNGSATSLISRLGGTLTTAPTDLKILAAVLIPDPTSPDRARYTPDQYATLTTARTRVRVHVERLADDSIRAYGFYTGKHRDWENIPVVAAIAEGEQFVAQLGQGIKLILTPGTTPIPVLKSTHRQHKNGC
ncbi:MULTISPECIES: S-type pyocin domain-containing protein [unclassified Pseudomonas]|uniref:S-type pyocin domain-containing protein n=1 Tax=unclassified Pseudomonas TaxID=196821 RepID=UPI000BA2FBE9|nr:MULTISPECIES: S-type pyocin domain-containing protein [unclassified Pseudomonas]MDN4544615.1 S-type pyocin domain-containing protein [Pseudomonas sp. C32]